MLDGQLSNKTGHVQKRKWKAKEHQWKSSMVSRDDFFEVKQVGLIHNASDFGTRPLSQQRLKFLLRKCNEIDGDGNRVREKERQELKRERES